MDWTLETSQPCDFIIYCSDLAKSDCASFVGDKGGRCEWNDAGSICRTQQSQTWQTSKYVSKQIVGCEHFSFDYSGCTYSVPIPPAGGCAIDPTSNRCVNVDPANPGRVLIKCSQEVKVDNSTSQDISDTIDHIQSTAQSYKTNASATGVSSSIDITQYIARQLESNWTMTAATCMSLTSALLGTNYSEFMCNDVPQCDSFAQVQAYLSAANILCGKVKDAHIEI